MKERYWLVHPNGGRQLIDPAHFDLERLSQQVSALGGSLQVERGAAAIPAGPTETPVSFDPPVRALAPLFRTRLTEIHVCRIEYHLDVSHRPTLRVLGGYYPRRRLVRVYSHDRGTGRRPLEELFDTFLHEIAHHLEYTEPDTFRARKCGRVPGRMHSQLFWRIFGELKLRWAEHQDATR